MQTRLQCRSEAGSNIPPCFNFGRTMTKIEIYCPECAKTGRKKLLMKADSEAHGTVYPYCKECRREVKIELNKSL